MPNNPVTIVPRIGCDSICVGQDKPLLLIAGPCVLQEETSLKIAVELQKIVEHLNKDGLPIELIFKGSFDKANRTSGSTWRGLGLDKGLDLLMNIKLETGLPVTTDIHESYQAAEVAEVCDMIQIPAFLARQTSLLQSAAATSRPVHVKKGQFMSPYDMKHVVTKLESAGCSNILLGERGTFFGYGQLVNDFRSLIIMKQWGTPIVFDATHSVQQPSGQGDSSGGNREFVRPLARAAAAVGIDALFLETHFNPDESPSDGPNMIPLDSMEELLREVLRIRILLEIPFL